MINFRKRIYGIETEYGTMLQEPNNALSSTNTIPMVFRLNPIEDSLFIWSDRHLWHGNGSVTYVDTGDHPEHATPECQSIYDLLAYHAAGDILTARIFGIPDQDGNCIRLFKNNIGLTENNFWDLQTGTFGCHENYLMANLLINEREAYAHFLPFLITRQILDGAGWFEDERFCLSQRALSMMTAIGESTIARRAIICEKHKSESVAGGTRRLHLILGDSNMLDVARFLKFGTTPLVISLLEHQILPPVQCAEDSEITSLRELSRNADPMLPCILTTDGLKSAHTIQWMYLEEIKKQMIGATFASEKTERDAKDTVTLWESALNAIAADDIKWMLGKLDWATKRYLVDRELAQQHLSHKTKRNQIKKDMDIAYHAVGGEHTVLERILGALPDRRLVSKEAVLQAAANPPPDTRACLRSQFIRLLMGRQIPERIHLDWQNWGEWNHIGNLFTMLDPFVSQDFGHQEFLGDFFERANMKPNQMTK